LSHAGILPAIDESISLAPADSMHGAVKIADCSSQTRMMRFHPPLGVSGELFDPNH
jgi:hypothetical protein